MRILKENIENISRLSGEFKSPSLERDFQKYMLQDNIASSRKFILGIALLFQLYIIPDFFYFEDLNMLLVPSLIRLLYLISAVYYYLRIERTKFPLYQCTSIYEIVQIVLLWTLLFTYPRLEIMSHRQVYILFMMVILLSIPNRFFYKITLSLILILGITLILKYKEIHYLADFSGDLFIFTLLILFFSAFNVRTVNRLQRIQYNDALALERLSTTDGLTNTYNRRKYDQDLAKEIARTKRYENPFSGIMFDIDDFKRVNDDFGHPVGDKVLIKYSSTVKSLIRENDQVYRWGGEEFIILLPNTNLEAALKLSNRIKTMLHQVDFSPVSNLTCSFGVTSWQKNDTADTFTTRLDRLLYQAKENGKACIVAH